MIVDEFLRVSTRKCRPQRSEALKPLCGSAAGVEVRPVPSRLLGPLAQGDSVHRQWTGMLGLGPSQVGSMQSRPRPAPLGAGRSEPPAPRVRSEQSRDYFTHKSLPKHLHRVPPRASSARCTRQSHRADSWPHPRPLGGYYQEATLVRSSPGSLASGQACAC